MFRKLLSVSLVAVMLSVTAFANPELATLDASLTANAEGVFTYAESKITSVTEGDATHAAELTPWDGKAATVAPDGDGSPENPYQIKDGADLAWFANHVNEYTGAGADAVFNNKSANAILMNDINLANATGSVNNWEDFRIAKGLKYKNDSNKDTLKQNEYSGTFDGNGHTIYNFYISAQSPTYDQGGLFRKIGTGAVVKNINFENAKAVSNYYYHDSTTNKDNTTTETYTAIVCGYMVDGTIQNVSVSGTIKVGNGKYANTAGSIVSVLYKGTIKNCYSDVTIDLSMGGTGTNDDDITAAAKYGVGGIAGSLTSTSAITISECGFEGTINAPNSSRVGGIVGNLYSNSSSLKIEKCYNTGNITGFRQVAGIFGWAYSGSYQKANDLIVSVYNTGDIVAKTTTDSYAAGISNGVYAKVMENVYSIGDVYVEVSGKKSFNNKCALLYVHNSSTTGANQYTIGTSAFCKDYTYVNDSGETKVKHSHAGNYSTKTYSKETGLTEEQFKDGTALTEALGTTNYTYLKGLNNGYPVLTWQATAPLTNANTYYVANDSLELALETAGYVTLEIAPLGESATVNGKTITEKGTYTLAATDAVTVTEGQALITIDLMNQTRAGSAVPALEATAIKAQLPATADRIVILALYAQDNTLKNVVYEEAALAGEKVSAVIDLSDVNVAGCELRAYVWENGTLVPQANDDSYVLTSSAN